MTKLEAIALIGNALKHNPKFKKDFTDYIELHIIESLEANKITLSTEKETKFVKDAAARILSIFDIDWARMAFSD